MGHGYLLALSMHSISVYAYAYAPLLTPCYLTYIAFAFKPAISRVGIGGTYPMHMLTPMRKSYAALLSS
jgi:hypothetical protein